MTDKVKSYLKKYPKSEIIFIEDDNVPYLSESYEEFKTFSKQEKIYILKEYGYSDYTIKNLLG